MAARRRFRIDRAGDEPPLRAIVRWTRDGKAGMEFILPVPPGRREWRDLIDSPLGA